MARMSEERRKALLALVAALQASGVPPYELRLSLFKGAERALWQEAIAEHGRRVRERAA